jgi:hypothetical protein
MGYNLWRDTKKPTQILMELCRTMNVELPDFAPGLRSVKVGDHTFECDPALIEFVTSVKNPNDLVHRKGHHETIEEYIRQNTALAALHGWGKKVNPVKNKNVFFFRFFIINFYIEMCVSS